jgi:peptide/nickel transport system substrate-binding protein
MKGSSLAHAPHPQDGARFAIFSQDRMVRITPFFCARIPAPTFRWGIFIIGGVPMKTFSLFVIVLLLAACGGIAPAPAATGPAGKLVIDQSVDAQSMDPYLVNQVAGESVMKMVFDHLIERDFDGKLVPGLAESWKIVDDKTLEFKLRTGVSFHNGESFDAAAVKFSMERMLNADLKSAFRGNFKSVASVKVVDPQSVQILLSATDAAILDNLSAQLAIVPPRYVAQVGDAEFARKPIGTGPFKFVEWVKDDHITLEANIGYWAGSFKGKPLVQSVIFRPVPEVATRIADLKAGKVDMIVEPSPDQVQGLKDAGYNIIAKDAPAENFIFFATDTPNTPFADKRVRQALQMGVDLDSILKNVLGGYGQRIATPIGPLTLGYDPNIKPYRYDLAKAKALLAEAGYANGFDVVIDVTNTARSTPTEAIAGELVKLNVRATIRKLDLGTFNDNWSKKQASPMVSASWSGLFDPASALNFWTKSDGLLTRYKNPEADRLITEAASTLDQGKRAQIYTELSRLLYDDPLALYLWTNQNLYASNKRISGWKAHPRSYIVASGVIVQ